MENSRCSVPIISPGPGVIGVTFVLLLQCLPMYRGTYTCNGLVFIRFKQIQKARIGMKGDLYSYNRLPCFAFSCQFLPVDWAGSYGLLFATSWLALRWTKFLGHNPCPGLRVRGGILAVGALLKWFHPGNLSQVFDRHSWEFLDDLGTRYNKVVKLTGLFGVRYCSEIS